MTDIGSNPISESHLFRFSLIREAALEALRPVDSSGDALLLLARTFTNDMGTKDIALGNAGVNAEHFLVTAVNEAARNLFSRNILSETLERVNRDLDTALRTAIRDGRLPVEKQRMMLHGIPFHVSMRLFAIEDSQFIGIALSLIEETGLKPEPVDEASILSNPTDDERTLARRLALRALYEIDASKHAPGNAISTQLKLVQELPRTTQYVLTLVNGILQHTTAIDDVIQRFAPDFPIDQLALIDRNILRMAIFEFAVDGRVPVGAAIDEAVELAKIYGADGSAAFVNGVLGSVADDQELIAELRARSQAQGVQDMPTPPDEQAHQR